MEMTVGDVSISWLGHASFLIEWSGKLLYIDPFKLPPRPKPADYVLITHDHFDHCCNVDKVSKGSTKVLATRACLPLLSGYNVLPVSPGQTIELGPFLVKTVLAYNPSKPFHPKGSGVGYIIKAGDVKVYHSGDTDVIPEMKEFAREGITVALLACGGKYTMDMSEAAHAAKAIKPKIVVPMHYGQVPGTSVDPQELVKLLAGTGIEVRVL